MKGSRSGPNTIVCGDCFGLMDFDYLSEIWRHVDTGLSTCPDTGDSESPYNEGQAEADDEALAREL